MRPCVGIDAKIRYLWPPGPYALASAAARFVEALIRRIAAHVRGFVRDRARTRTRASAEEEEAVRAPEASGPAAAAPPNSPREQPPRAQPDGGPVSAVALPNAPRTPTHGARPLDMPR